MRRRSSRELVDFDPEPERTLREKLRLSTNVSNQSTPVNSPISSSPESTPPPSPNRRRMPTLSDEGLPTAAQVPTGTLAPNLTATRFKIDPSFYNLVRKEQFGGALDEDPANHINRFCDLCQMITDEDVTQDQLKRMMFPHSLRDKASSWLRTLNAAESNTWTTLVLAFYRKFFPPERTANLRMQITGFRQRLNESLYDAWERFKSLERQCPHHNFGAGFIAMTFYNSLTADSRRILDSAANGQFDTVEVADARGIIEKMANHSISYVQSSYTTVGAVAGSDYFQQNLTSQIEDLKTQLASLKVDNTPLIAPLPAPISAVQFSQPMPMICNACGLYGHTIYACQSTQEQVSAFQNYQQNSPYGQNFQQPYKQPYQPQFHQSPPPSNPSTSSSAYQHPNKPQAFKPPSFTDMNDLRTMLIGMQKSQEHLIAQVTKIDQEKSSAIKSMETQLAQLADAQARRQQGQLPAQPNKPGGNIQQAMAITLRSGASYDTSQGPNASYEVEENEDELSGAKDALADAPRVQKKAQFADPPVLLKPHQSVRPDTDRSGVGNQPETGKGKGKADGSGIASGKGDKGTEKATDPPIVIKLPFPNRLKSKKLENQLGKFMEVVKNLQVTVPFTELITQVPSYAKFMKDILTKKRSFNDTETIAFTGQCSAYLQNNSPPKLQDPGSFSIPCTIGTHVIEKALCDLGASVSIIPYSVCEKLNMGELKMTSITLQMADRSVKRPLGILEDVPVKVGKYFIPVDFVVLDIAEDTHIPIILGRPFLHTAGAIIDVKNGKLTLNIGDDKVTFNLSKAMRSPMIEETSYAIDIVDEVIVDTWESSLSRDPSDALIRLDPCAGESLFYDTGLDLESFDNEAGESHVAVFKENPPIGEAVYQSVGCAVFAAAANLVGEGCEELKNSDMPTFAGGTVKSRVRYDRVAWRPGVINGDDIPFT